MGDKCCKNVQKGEEKLSESDQKLADKFLPYDASQEPIFPSELQASRQTLFSLTLFRVGQKLKT